MNEICIHINIFQETLETIYLYINYIPCITCTTKVLVVYLTNNNYNILYFNVKHHKNDVT